MPNTKTKQTKKSSSDKSEAKWDEFINRFMLESSNIKLGTSSWSPYIALQDLLKYHDQQIIKEIEGMRKSTDKNKLGLNDKNIHRLLGRIFHIDGYNQVLDDVITHLKTNHE